MRHGFLLIDKPAGITSHDAVGIVRKTLHEKNIGHLGTLDPAATGLLVLAVGKKALKVIELFGSLSKEYEADVLFGKVSTTYDREGIIKQFDIGMGWMPPEHSQLQKMINERFTGKISQVPPAHSAVHVSGERAYNKARRAVNRSVATGSWQEPPFAIPARMVDIDRCDILTYAYPHLRLSVACGSGTYIRSLANDLGEVLRCGAYLAGLRRTKVGVWTAAAAKSADEAGWAQVMPLKDILKDMPRRDLSSMDYEDVQHGKNLEAEVAPNTIGWHEDLPVAILVPAPDGTAHAKKVF